LLSTSLVIEATGFVNLRVIADTSLGRYAWRAAASRARRDVRADSLRLVTQRLDDGSAGDADYGQVGGSYSQYRSGHLRTQPTFDGSLVLVVSTP